VQNEIPKKFGLNSESDSFDLFLSEDGEARVKVKHESLDYEIKLFQLVKEGEGGVWTPVRIKTL